MYESSVCDAADASCANRNMKSRYIKSGDDRKLSVCGGDTELQKGDSRISKRLFSELRTGIE